MLGVYTLVAFRIIPIINKILTSAQHIRFTQPSFIKLNSEQQKPIISKSINFEDFSFKKNITIKIKRFSYESKKNFYLKNINLNILKGSKIGIIGPSGSGKSTIIDIICGFTKLKNGNVFIDGKNIFENLEGYNFIIKLHPATLASKKSEQYDFYTGGLDWREEITDFMDKSRSNNLYFPVIESINPLRYNLDFRT